MDIFDYLSKADIFIYNLKFILLPQVIATLNNYACLLPPLANGLLFQSVKPRKSTTGEVVPMEGSDLAVGT